MLTTTSERFIQFKRVAVLCDLSADSEKIVRYAAWLARWYGSEMLLAHAEPPEFYPSIPMEALPIWPPSGSSAAQEAEARLKSLVQSLELHDLAPKILVRTAGIGAILKELEDYRPNLLALATHGREGIRKWLAGSVAEEVFRQVQWPVLVLGPGVNNSNGRTQKQFERILYATDLSGASLKALQYAAGVARDHQAQLIVLHVDSNPGEGFSFDRVMELQRLEDWIRDQFDGFSETPVNVRCVVEFGKPEKKVVAAATEREADIVILGARGMGTLSTLASHFIGGTAYEVICSSPCPVLIVPHSR